MGREAEWAQHTLGSVSSIFTFGKLFKKKVVSTIVVANFNYYLRKNNYSKD